MSSAFDAAVIGAGSNGLVAAARLAADGWRTVVIEARGGTGGQLTPHVDVNGACVLSARPVRLAAPIDRWLKRGGLLPPEIAAWPHPDPALTLPVDGRPRLLTEDRTNAARTVPGYVPFAETANRLAGAIAPLLRRAPPALEGLHLSDLAALLSTLRSLQRLDRRDAHLLCRWPSMPAADLVHEWFDDEAVRAAVAGIPLIGRNASPRSPWSALPGLWDRAVLAGGGRAVLFREGPAALAGALTAAAERAGAEIRCGLPVCRLTIREERATGLVLADGEEIAARAIISAVDPRATLLGLIEPEELDPELRDELGHMRGAGDVAALTLDLDELPPLPRVDASESLELLRAAGGHVFIGPTLDHLERAFDAAKYGDVSPEPVFDLMMTGVLHSAGNGARVVTMTAQHVPLVTREAVDAGRLEGEVLAALERVWPGFTSRVRTIRSAAPAVIAQAWHVTGGHLHHLDMAPDQLWSMRPHPQCARYDAPVRGLFLCGAGTHPGGGAPGMSGWIASRIVSRALRRMKA